MLTIRWHKHMLFVLQMERKDFEGAPYVLHNCTGLTAQLLLKDNHDFTVHLTKHVAQSYE